MLDGAALQAALSYLNYVVSNRVASSSEAAQRPTDARAKRVRPQGEERSDESILATSTNNQRPLNERAFLIARSERA
jgi:hypothetical protein